jgi:hypothetical protein
MDIMVMKSLKKGMEKQSCVKRQLFLREMLKMKTHGLAVLSWPLIFRPLHDGLIEDSLTCAEVRLELEPKISNWSTWVKLLRWVITGGARSQELLNKAMLVPS